MKSLGVGGLDLQYNRLGRGRKEGDYYETEGEAAKQVNSSGEPRERGREIRANLQERRKRIRRGKRAGNSKLTASLLLTGTGKGRKRSPVLLVG